MLLAQIKIINFWVTFKFKVIIFNIRLIKFFDQSTQLLHLKGKNTTLFSVKLSWPHQETQFCLHASYNLFHEHCGTWRALPSTACRHSGVLCSVFCHWAANKKIKYRFSSMTIRLPPEQCEKSHAPHSSLIKKVNKSRCDMSHVQSHTHTHTLICSHKPATHHKAENAVEEWFFFFFCQTD